LALLRNLTGVQTLDAGIAGQYLDRLNSSPLQPALATILHRFRDIPPGPAAADQVKKKIVADDELRPVVSQIILLWYTSAMRDSERASLALRFGTPEAISAAWSGPLSARTLRAFRWLFRALALFDSVYSLMLRMLAWGFQFDAAGREDQLRSFCAVAIDLMPRVLLPMG
jgi:hypothetical protein